MEPSFTARADYYELEHAARLGVLLPAASVRALEEILPLNPADMVNRARLLGHYWNAYKQLSEESQCELQLVHSARTQHILWFVENAPDCVFAGDVYLSCHAIHDKVNYERVKGAWEKQVKSHHDFAKTRVNFALFLREYDVKFCGILLAEVLRREPLNEWGLALQFLIGDCTKQALPLAVDIVESGCNGNRLQLKIADAVKAVDWTSSRSCGTKSTVRILEQVLQELPFEFLTRLEILRWCRKNIERANLLGYDPEVAQIWFRHALWLVAIVPGLALKIGCGLKEGLAVTVPRNFFEPIQKMLLKALGEEGADAEQIFENALPFFQFNLGASETKSLVSELAAWKGLDAKIRRRFRRELNWKDPRVSIWEKNIDLIPMSVYIEGVAKKPCSLPSEINLWLDDLELDRARHDGWRYSHELISALERANQPIPQDLVIMTRLIGVCMKSLSSNSLSPRQIQLLVESLSWIITNAPESWIASKLCFFEKTDFESEPFNALKSAWLAVLESSPDDSTLAANAAAWFAYSDPSLALEITNKVLALDSVRGDASNLINFIQTRSTAGFGLYVDLEFESVCASKAAISDAPANLLLASICDQIDLNIYALLDRLTIPLRTLWTNELLLEMNPNDLILRSEILGWCKKEMLGADMYLQDLNVAALFTTHVLWLLENVPHADLHFFIRIFPTQENSVYAKVLKKAVFRLRKKHGKFVAKYRPQFPRKKK